MLPIKLPGPSSRSPKPKQIPYNLPFEPTMHAAYSVQTNCGVYMWKGGQSKQPTGASPGRRLNSLPRLTSSSESTCFNEIGASPRMRQEFAEYHAGKQPGNKKSWHISGNPCQDAWHLQTARTWLAHAFLWFEPLQHAQLTMQRLHQSHSVLFWAHTCKSFLPYFDASWGKCYLCPWRRRRKSSYKKRRDASALPDLIWPSLSRCSDVCIKEIARFSSIVALLLRCL